MMTAIAAIIGSIVWAAFVFGLLYVRQTPQAQVRRRMLAMIDAAESVRMKAAREKAAAAPKKIERKTIDSRSFYARIIRPTVRSFVQFLHELTPPAIIARLEMKIFRAGKQGIWSVQRVAAMWCLSIVLGVALAIVLINIKNFLLLQKILLLIVGGIFGALLPFMVLNSMIRTRQRKIKRQLPEFLDLLCVSVQAGLSFDGAVAKIVARLRSVLSDEFKHVLDDIKFGMTKQYALNQMAKRCDIEEIYLFTTSVIQAEKLGTSMAQTLQLQADNIRDRHRQFVRTQAMKAPVKMLFPMVIFIFPSIFVVLLLPSLLSLIKSLGNGGPGGG